MKIIIEHIFIVVNYFLEIICNIWNFKAFRRKNRHMAEISMKKVALSGILICPMELTNRKSRQDRKRRMYEKQKNFKEDL